MVNQSREKFLFGQIKGGLELVKGGNGCLRIDFLFRSLFFLFFLFFFICTLPVFNVKVSKTAKI